MSKLALLTLVPALLGLIGASGLLFYPGVVRAWLHRFPRDIWSGRVLSAIAIAWAAWIMRDMPFGRFEAMKPMLFPIAILLGVLVWFAMDELLAPRALGALLLLYPAPLLAAARIHPSRWSVVMSVVAYIMIVKGISLMLSPYLLRVVTERALRGKASCNVIGAAGLLVSVAMLLLAFLVY